MIRFALVGYGKMGKRWEGVLGKHLSIIVDPNKGQFSNLDEVLSGYPFSIDAVLIATPHKYLAEISEKALKAGKHVLCEKPGAISSKQIKKNIKIAKKKGLVYKIGYNYRFHDAFIKTREMYEMGEIGDILFIRIAHGFGGRDGYEKEWRISKEFGGGGHLHDQGVHLIDMAKSFMGEIDGVEGFRSDAYWGSGTEDNAFVLLKGGSQIASIHSSLTQWKRMHRFEIYGTKGYIQIDGLGQRYSLNGEVLTVGKRTKDPDIIEETIRECDSVADHSLELELEEFISAVEKGTPLNPSAEESYETLKIVEDIYRKDRI